MISYEVIICAIDYVINQLRQRPQSAEVTNSINLLERIKEDLRDDCELYGSDSFILESGGPGQSG